MAAATRKPAGLPIDILLRKGAVDKADRDWLFAQGARNRDYFWERRDDLLREHRGKWAIVYGDCQLLIGDDRAELRRGIALDDLRVAYTEFLDDADGIVDCPSIFG